jgi:hypothetical protein
MGAQLADQSEAQLLVSEGVYIRLAEQIVTSKKPGAPHPAKSFRHTPADPDREAAAIELSLATSSSGVVSQGAGHKLASYPPVTA